MSTESELIEILQRANSRTGNTSEFPFHFGSVLAVKCGLNGLFIGFAFFVSGFCDLISKWHSVCRAAIGTISLSDSR